MNFFSVVRHQWDRAAAAAAFVLGLVALLIGWLGISDAKLPTQQIPYLASAGLLGVFALGASCTLWLSADLRDEWRKLDVIHQELVAQRGSTPAPAERTEINRVPNAEVTPAERPMPRAAQAAR